MRNKILLCIFIILLLPTSSLDARTKRRSYERDLLFPPRSKTKFQNQPGARRLYDKMIETMRKAETLSYESEGWLENRGQTSTTIKKKNWLKKPNFARVEVLHTRTGEVITTLIGDGDYFWTFWQDGFPRSRNERWQNVYMKEPVEGYSIARDARLLTSRPVIDPSIFHVSTDEPWWQSHMDGVRRVGTEKVGDEECEVIEVIFMNRRISQYLWLAKVDHLPRKLKKVVLSSRLEEPRGESIKHEIWTNVRINAEIPMENFVWKPPSSWRRITQSMLLPREHSVTESINLSGKWKYTFGDNTSWSGRDYDDREWDTAEVPYILPSLKAGKYLWLRKMFFVPEHYKGQKYGLDLGLLSAPVSVYFNGDLVAESEKDSPLILLKPLNVMFGENNVIALRIERKETDMIVWTGEPLLVGLSGWIETGYFNEEYYTVVHYMIYVPKNYNPDKVFPLVIAMPGYPYGSRSFMGSDIVKFAESRGYIVLCPEARPGERGHRWIVRAQREVLLILSEMKEDYIDARRIYIMGQSNGGFAAYYIGFHNSELFAGITSCSGGIGSKIELLPRMAKAAKEFIPIYIVHGAKDRVIPISRARYMLHELKRLGYECQLQLYPQGGHYVIRDDVKNIFDFFDRHAKQGVPKAWERLERKRLRRLPTSEKKLIVNVIKKYAKGLSQKDIKQVMACFSRKYFTDGMTYPDVRDKTSNFFSDNDSIEMKLKDVKIMLNADDVAVIAIVQYRMRYGDANEAGGKLWLKFVKEDKNWKIVGGSLYEPQP